jgi:hypothetical protein
VPQLLAAYDAALVGNRSERRARQRRP